MAAGAALTVLIGSPIGFVAGLVAAITLARWLARLPSAAVQREREQISRALPLTADLLAAALSAGTTPQAALQVVGEVTGGPLGGRLCAVATALRLGADPHTAWAGFSSEPGCAPLARAMAGSAARGSSPLVRLTGVADEARIRARWAAEAKARAVGARAAAPLGLCFLPAFVLLGIVPLIVAAASTIG